MINNKRLPLKMAKNIDDILFEGKMTKYTNESISEATNMIFKMCEKYGSDFAGKYIASLTEDTDLQIREDDTQQEDQNNNNQQQNNQQNQGGQITQDMANDFNTIMQSLTKFQETCKGTPAEKFIGQLMTTATQFKAGIDKAVAPQNNNSGNSGNNQQNQNQQSGQQNNNQQPQNISNQ